MTEARDNFRGTLGIRDNSQQQDGVIPQYGSYHFVKDIKSGKTIAGGIIINGKISPWPLISFDYKHFFHAEGNDKYEVVKEDENPYGENFCSIPVNYKQAVFSGSDKSFDVYYEYDISEVDPEIKELITYINKIPGCETIGSCSGHGQTMSHAFISIKFSSFKAVHDLLDNIPSLRNMFNLYVQEGNEHIERDKLMLRAESLRRGNHAIEDLNIITKELKDKYHGN